MQAWEDQIFAIDQQIKQFNLQKLESPSKKEQRQIDKQIEELQKKRDILQLQGELKFEPQTRQAEEAVETATGENKETTIDKVIARIAELEQSLAEGGKLNVDLSLAQADLDAYGKALDVKKQQISDIETELEGWNTQLDIFKQKIEDLNAQKITINLDYNTPQTTTAAATPVDNTNVMPDIKTLPSRSIWEKYLVGISPPLAAYLGLKELKGIAGYAEGGLITRPQLAMVGEQGPELITPLDKLSEGLKFDPAHIHVYLDGEQIMEYVDRNMFRRNGVSR
jgi:leucyl aminopeptidase